MEKSVNRSVELSHTSGLRTKARLTSIASEDRFLFEVHEYSSITHKRVTLHFREEGANRDFSISLAPVGAMALVRRLVDVLNVCQREGADIPNLHSDLAYKSAKYLIDGDPIPAEDLDALASYANTAYREVIG